MGTQSKRPRPQGSHMTWSPGSFVTLLAPKQNGHPPTVHGRGRGPIGYRHWEECGLAIDVIVAILTALDGNPYSTAYYLQDIPYDMVMRTVQNLPNDIAEFTPMTVGKVARWHHRSTEV